MFEIDFAGFAELEGGKPPHRLALEPIANVFDEYRGYVEDRKRRSYCAVTLSHQLNPRGVLLTVADDGPGFNNESDVWTLFGSTSKRAALGVAGRFNLGDKQLIAVARWTRVRTNDVTVIFDPSLSKDDRRQVTKHRTVQIAGTIVEVLMQWSLKDMQDVRAQLTALLPPDGLAYTVDGRAVQSPVAKCSVQVTLPTVKLRDGVMAQTTNKTVVRVLKTTTPTLFELGIPVCDLSDLGFPWSLDVQQKVPVPPSRDTVSSAYLLRLIGTVLEQSALDGIRLLTEEEQGAGFVRTALDWVRDHCALQFIARSLFGENAVRRSSDPLANAKAAAAGAPIIDSRALAPDTRRRMEEAHVLPTSRQAFGGIESLPRTEIVRHCPECGAIL